MTYFITQITGFRIPAGLLFSLLLITNVHAQNGNSQDRSQSIISVSVSASIQTSIQVETLSNINFGRVSPGMTEIYINPRQDAGAGIMRITGQPNTLVRVSFLERRELIRIGGGQNLFFNFEVSAASEDDQFISEPLTMENRQIALSENGDYYFWIGGRMDLQGISFGQYEGEFTLEIDYI